MGYASMGCHLMGHGLIRMIQSVNAQWVMGHGLFSIIHYETLNGSSFIVQSFIFKIRQFDWLLRKFVPQSFFGMIINKQVNFQSIEILVFFNKKNQCKDI